MLVLVSAQAVKTAGVAGALPKSDPCKVFHISIQAILSHMNLPAYALYLAEGGKLSKLEPNTSYTPSH